MTNPNNGASLEDCHSNFFALTDLCGIKWRRLVSDGYLGSSGHHPPHHHHHQPHGPLDDPVLSSYARCLASDILCVWRRSPNAKQNQSTFPPDPFQPGTATPTQTSPHFMQHGPPGGSAPTSQQQQNQSQLGMHSHHNMQMMSPHLIGGHGPGQHSQSPGGGVGPPPYPSSGQPHSQTGQSFSTSLSPITPHSLFNSTNSNSSPNNGPTLSGPKELWIFWYGEEPDLSSLVHARLLKSESEQGSWENGLSYECRTLLFKALHNLIERCLLARDFVRIGKWFIQPSEEHSKSSGSVAGGLSNSGPGNNSSTSSSSSSGSSSNSNGNSSSNSNRNNFPMQLSFSFSFFVHGESTVCMSVDVRQHPSVKRVSKQHLLACQSPNQTVPVILAPYGLAGTLTGVGYRMSDPGTHKILEEWKQFYPVEAALKSPFYDVSTSNSTQGPHSSPQSSATNGGGSQQPSPGMAQGASALSSAGIPPVLEVIVGGVRMRYPSCYVLCTELDDLPRSLDSSNSSNVSSSSSVPAALKSKSSPTKTVKDSEAAACPVKSPGRPQGSLTTLQKVSRAGVAGVVVQGHFPVTNYINHSNCMLHNQCELCSDRYCFVSQVDKVEGLLPERVWQETILPSQQLNNNNNNNKTHSNNESLSNTSSAEQLPPTTHTTNSCDSTGQWDFIDPSKKLGCSCSK